MEQTHLPALSINDLCDTLQSLQRENALLSQHNDGLTHQLAQEQASSMILAQQVSQLEKELLAERQKSVSICQQHTRLTQIVRNLKLAMTVWKDIDRHENPRSKSCEAKSRTCIETPTSTKITRAHSNTKHLISKERKSLPNPKTLLVIQSYIKILAEHLSLQYSPQNLKTILQKVAEIIKMNTSKEPQHSITFNAPDIYLSHTSQLSSLENQILRKVSALETELEAAQARADDLAKENEALKVEIENSKKYKLRKIISSSKKSPEDIRYYQEVNNFKDVLDFGSIEHLVFSVNRRGC
jgi:hypothetical protein